MPNYGRIFKPPVFSSDMGWKLDLDAISARASSTELSAINSCEWIAAFEHHGLLQLLVLRAGSSQTKSHVCTAHSLEKCGHQGITVWTDTSSRLPQLQLPLKSSIVPPLQAE